MLYTGKGDDGTTYFFGSKERFGKDDKRTEALGAVDELNSLLGYLKVILKKDRRVLGKSAPEVIERVQQNLFIIQAELAGADKKIESEKIEALSELINKIEKNLPEIKTFLVSGANEISALFDYARTIARKAERRVVALGTDNVDKNTLAYLNRLSSLLYAFARLSAHKRGDKEEPPIYK